ncbi:ubiquitin carboxyl-terminal hydrolase 25-like [Oratosquilla oratoria]|uniref:ubiquitin carboxyl-terminal hydrolase 25-like n=1 Tax=Oratosquilla oratoria TaxID=337810 RepID=UPI003F777B20
MCGVARETPGDSELVPPLEGAMPPSVTLGSEPQKPSVAQDPTIQQQQLTPAVAKDIKTIDLSCDEKDDLQKAIALSLQDQQETPSLQGITAEDCEVSRALEASLRDSQPLATVDLNPKERKRQGGTPVGLKNIGNSCWFNVVIQPLFRIPGFRDMIIKYSENSVDDVNTDNNATIKPSQSLVVHLRKLFALMIGTEKKYLDPTECVNLFQGNEIRKNSQQDVCEFTHKLLERLEEEYQGYLRRQGIEKESSGTQMSKDGDFENPIMKLFYGQSKKETTEEEGSSKLECEFTDDKLLEEYQDYVRKKGEAESSGTQVSKEANFGNPIMKLFYGQSKKEACEEDGGPKLETFGQYPLHVMNYRDIHESILASMSSGMPDISGETVAPVQQETWFKILPPVLIFSLSRYEYSLEKQRAEKVHNKFEFPEYLYMDRYMETNKKIVKEKHQKSAKLREELNCLTKTLEKYIQYGSGSSKYPLSDILKYTLEFAQTGVNNPKETETSPVPSPSKMDIDGAEASENDIEMDDVVETKWEAKQNHQNKEVKSQETVNDNKAPEKVEAVQHMSSPSKRMRILPPVPKTLTKDELNVLQSCLMRWQQDVDCQVAELNNGIKSLNEQLSTMYDEPGLQRVPYKLHSVTVHEGQASAGHYFVYIFDHASNVWIKFNDTQVAKSSWDELLQDSIGGQRNASAYCLMYIDQSRYNLLFPPDNTRTQSSMTKWPIDLQEYVKADNLAFRQELQEWEQKEKGDNALVHIGHWDNSMALAPITAPNSPQENDESLFFTEVKTMLTETILDAMKKEDSNITNRGQGKMIQNLLSHEIMRLKDFAEAKADPCSYKEPSIIDFGVYLFRNKVNNQELIEWYGLDVIRLVTRGLERTKLMDVLLEETSECLQSLMENKSRAELYKGWLNHYRTLVHCAWHVVYGYMHYEKKQLEKALPLFMRACQLNQILEEHNPPGPRKTLDQNVLSKCRSMCLLDLNEQLIKLFLTAETEEAFMDIPMCMNTLIRPCLASFSEQSQDDSATASKVGNRWCEILERDLGSKKKSEMITEIFESVFTVSGSSEGVLPYQIPRPPSVLRLYSQYNEVCSKVLALGNSPVTQMSDL